MRLTPRITKHQTSGGTVEQNKRGAPPYRCPGCFVELVAGTLALEHFNHCSVLRKMIAGDTCGFFAWNGGIGAAKEKKTVKDTQQHDSKKPGPPLQHWKVNGPVVSIAAERIATPVEMEAPAVVKKRNRKSGLRPGRFKPHPLLDTLIETLTLENDAALAETLQVRAPVISKIRGGKLPVGASILMRMHEASDMPIARLRALIPEYTRYNEVIDESDEPREH